MACNVGKRRDDFSTLPKYCFFWLEEGNGKTPMNQPVKLTAGGIRWLVRAEVSEALFGPDGLRLEEWLRTGQAEVVKHGPHRTVYRVGLPGLDVHVKHYRLMDARAWLRELVRPAKALLECRHALAVAQRDIPTIEPLAIGRAGVTGHPGDSFLITRSLTDTDTVSSFLEITFPTLPIDEQTWVRQCLATELGRFIARLHQCGIAHHDLHAGNILLRREADGRLCLFLIDLHAARLGRPLDTPARWANLVLLNRYFSMRACRSDRLRFWRAYNAEFLAENATGKDAARALSNESAVELERQTWESNLQFWRGRDSRCLGTNRYYQRVRSASTVGHAVRDMDAATLDAILADPDEPFTRPDVKLLKDTRSTTVAELTLMMNGQPRVVIYKRFRVTTWTDPLAAMFRRPPALRSWITGHGLRERDLPTPRPLAVLHRRRHGLLWEGYLLVEKVADAMNLDRFVASLGALPVEQRRPPLRCCIDQVARLLRDLHARHLSHRDIKASNILVRSGQWTVDSEKESLTSLPTVSVIDLVGVRRYRQLPDSRRLQNLARLHVSFCNCASLTRTDKLRFLRTYLQWGLLGKRDWKSWWRLIAQATQRKVARNLRSGRPLG
jgi:tRNA A-37 threonylcarbamoyl transferase component Bud32